MLESFFVQEQVLSRLRSGPMGSYLPDLAVQLVQQHYARRTGCILLRTADRLGRWLVQEGVALADATARSPEVFCGQDLSAISRARRSMPCWLPQTKPVGSDGGTTRCC